MGRASCQSMIRNSRGQKTPNNDQRDKGCHLEKNPGQPSLVGVFLCVESATMQPNPQTA
jgi:hypothetical protein